MQLMTPDLSSLGLGVLVIASTAATAAFSLVLTPAKRRPRAIFRVGLSGALLVAGAVNLTRLAPTALELAERDLSAFAVALTLSTACAQIINGAFLHSRRTAPLTGWIMALDALWGVLTLVAWSSPPHPQDVAFNLCLASWAIYVSEALPAARRWRQIVGASWERLSAAVGSYIGEWQR